MKKNRILIYPLIIMGALFFLTFSCKKDDNNDSNTVRDIDGNVYHTVTIGTQTWMVENLKTTKYRNGDSIPNTTDNSIWNSYYVGGAYCDYENKPVNGKTNGRLYNWYAVDEGRNIAPTGWHVPSDQEWTILTDFLGGSNDAGGKLKETGTANWLSPNTSATNESGFTALPSGGRSYDGSFFNLYSEAKFWSSTEINGYAWIRILGYDYRYVGIDYSFLRSGRSVRCIKDN